VAPSFLQEDESDNSGEDDLESDNINLLDKSTQVQQKPQGTGAKVVLQMIGTIQQDLKKEFGTAKKEEDDAQSDYEEILAEAKSKREVTARQMTEKEGVKAAVEEELKKTADRVDGLSKQLGETVDIIANIHKDCDWLLANFAERKKLRAAEVNALQRAKSMLSSR